MFREEYGHLIFQLIPRYKTHILPLPVFSSFGIWPTQSRKMTDFQEIELFPSDNELSNLPETPQILAAMHLIIHHHLLQLQDLPFLPFRNGPSMLSCKPYSVQASISCKEIQKHNFTICLCALAKLLCLHSTTKKRRSNYPPCEV